MKFNDILKLDVTQQNNFTPLGYDPKKYYCGNWGWMDFYTLVRKYLNKIGVCFPFNTACFKHDVSYYEIQKEARFWKALFMKIKADYVFLKDMFKLINHFEKKQKNPLQEINVLNKKKNLKIRAVIYFAIVTVVITPFWAIHRKLKWRGE